MSLSMIMLDSRFGPLSSSPGGALRAALDAQPRWVAARRAWDTIVKAEGTLPQPVSAAAFTQDTTAALLAGKPLPRDFADRVHTAHEEEQRYPRAHQAFHDIARGIVNELSDAIRDADDDLHRHLSGQLNDAVDTARDALAALDGASDAEAAIRAGQAEAWASLTDARNRVEDVRAAQSTLRRRLWDDADVYDTLWPDAHEVANLLEVFPDYGLHRTLGLRDGAHPGEQVPTVDPRPAPGTLDRLAWLCSPDVRPWVPTRQEYQAAARALSEAIAEHRVTPSKHHAFTPGQSRRPFAGAAGRRMAQP